MTVKAGLAALAATLKVSVAKVVSAIMGASLIGLLKLGIIVGVSIATIIAIFKFFKDKRASYRNDVDSTVVERAVEENFHDLRKQQDLHPLMKKVKKNLNKDIKPRVKKRRSPVMSYEEFRKHIRQERESLELQEELEDFIKGLDHDEYLEREVVKYPANNTLRNVWINS